MATPVPFGRSRDAVVPEKALPHNQEAERSILGAVLLDNDSLNKAQRIVASADFYLPQNRLIFSAMYEMGDAGTPIDLITLMDKLQASEKLEMVGGVAYLSQLADGLPRATNIENYARIVADKATQRQLIHRAAFIQEQALSANPDMSAIQAATRDLDLDARGIKHSGLQRHTLFELSQLEIGPEEWVLDPLLEKGDRGEIVAPRGVGKTWVALEMGVCIAAGISPCFIWPVTQARPVIYVEGEMNKHENKRRALDLIRMHDLTLGKANVPEFICRTLQTRAIPKINTNAGRREIERHLTPGCVLELDNMSVLCPAADDKESEEWASIQDWIIDLSASDITTLFLSHAGWNPEHRRGTSKAEDQLAFVLLLRVPHDYHRGDGMRVNVKIDKLRGRAADPSTTREFEASIVDGNFVIKGVREQLEKQAFAMFYKKLRDNDIREILSLSRWQVYRLREKFEKLPPGTSFEM